MISIIVVWTFVFLSFIFILLMIEMIYQKQFKLHTSGIKPIIKSSQSEQITNKPNTAIKKKEYYLEWNMEQDKIFENDKKNLFYEFEYQYEFEKYKITFIQICAKFVEHYDENYKSRGMSLMELVKHNFQNIDKIEAIGLIMKNIISVDFTFYVNFPIGEYNDDGIWKIDSKTSRILEDILWNLFHEFDTRGFESTITNTYMLVDFLFAIGISIIEVTPINTQKPKMKWYQLCQKITDSRLDDWSVLLDKLQLKPLNEYHQLLFDKWRSYCHVEFPNRTLGELMMRYIHTNDDYYL